MYEFMNEKVTGWTRHKKRYRDQTVAREKQECSDRYWRKTSDTQFRKTFEYVIWEPKVDVCVSVCMCVCVCAVLGRVRGDRRTRAGPARAPKSRCPRPRRPDCSRPRRPGCLCSHPLTAHLLNRPHNTMTKQCADEPIRNQLITESVRVMYELLFEHYSYCN